MRGSAVVGVGVRTDRDPATNLAEQPAVTGRWCMPMIWEQNCLGNIPVSFRFYSESSSSVVYLRVLQRFFDV